MRCRKRWPIKASTTCVMCCTDGFPSVYFTVIPFWLHPSELFFSSCAWLVFCTDLQVFMPAERTTCTKGHNTHTYYDVNWKQRSWVMANSSSSPPLFWSRPQILESLAPILLSLKTILSLLPGFCHFYLWQFVWRSPLRVTKPDTVRHFHSLSGKRQDIFKSAAPLSDMAVPKALSITAGKSEERSRWLYRDLFAKRITGRHSPQSTIWHPHIQYLPPMHHCHITSSPIYSRSLAHLPTHTDSCKTATKILQTEELPSGSQSSGWQMSTHLLYNVWITSS